MATPLTCSLSVQIRAQSASHSSSLKQEPGRGRKSNWWAPLFGWSSDPDYLNNGDANANANANAGDASQKKQSISDLVPVPGRPRSRFALGCFTEEKAKWLRRKNMESASFHDLMYHSAIASRLASDVSDLQEK